MFKHQRTFRTRDDQIDLKDKVAIRQTKWYLPDFQIQY